MIAELNLGGVYLSTIVATALLAFIIAALVRKALGQTGLYRHVWHPALFDAALFVLLWAAITALPFGL
jgi:protein-S-isoprenylcysteine O-methyltransferase Ste14